MTKGDFANAMVVGFMARVDREDRLGRAPVHVVFIRKGDEALYTQEVGNYFGWNAIVKSLSEADFIGQRYFVDTNKPIYDDAPYVWRDGVPVLKDSFKGTEINWGTVKDGEVAVLETIPAKRKEG